MAFLASHLKVRPGKRELSLGVIKRLCGLPISSVVALQAIATKLALMLVLVATCAGLREA